MAQQQNPHVDDKTALRLDVVVKSGQNLKLSFWQKLKDPIHTLADSFDAFVSLETSRNAPGYEAFSSQRTTAIAVGDSGNVDWNETFSFVVPDGSESGEGGGRGTLTLAVFDQHTVLSDKPFSSDFKINIDQLTVTQEKVFQKQSFQFGDNASISAETCLRKLTEATVDMRFGTDLNPKEVEIVAKRKEICCKAISKLLGKDVLADKVPVVSIVASGGGFRSMTATAGSAQGLKDTGLLDCATYFSSLSGSTWYLSNLLCPDLYSKDGKPDVDQCADYLKECCAQMGAKLFLKNASDYVNELKRRRKIGLDISLVDLWGCYLASVFKMVINEQPGAKKVSQQRPYTETAEFPFPLYTGIHVHKNNADEKFSDWMEFSPYEQGYSTFGSFMKVEDLAGRSFKGVVCQQREELDVGYMMGLWGSAFGVSLREVLDRVKKDNLKLWNVLVELMLTNLTIMRIDELRPFAAALPNMLRGIEREWLESDRLDIQTVYGLNKEDVAQIDADLFSLLISKRPFKPDKDEKIGDEEMMLVVDAGIDFNDPIPPVIRPKRRSDVLIILDNSGRDNQWNDVFEQLDLAAKWAQNHSVEDDVYKFPKIDHSKFDKNNIVESYVFEDEEDPECPIVIFFPLCNPNLKKQPDKDKPADGQNEVNPFGFSYNTFNITALDPKDFDGLRGLCESNIKSGFEKIKEAIAKKANR